jgi:hypothetical protein
MADKPRRPYLHLNDDEYASRRPQTASRSLFRQPSRYIRAALAKESEFEKPYLSSDPRVVHLDPPEPWWPNYKLPPFYPPNPLPGSPPQWILIPPDDHEYPGCPCCFNVVWNECDDELWSGGRYPLVWNQEYHPSKGFKHSWKIKGDYKGDTIIHEPISAEPNFSSFGDQWDNFYFQFEDSHEGADSWSYVTLCKVIAGVCEHCEEYWAMCEGDECCTSPTYVAPTNDSTVTPETIARSSEVTIAILDGCPDFTWSVTGTGFTLEETKTAGRLNKLIASGTACGAAIITVVDSCSMSTTIELRCTTGVWTKVADSVRSTNRDDIAGCGGSNWYFPSIINSTSVKGIQQVTITNGLAGYSQSWEACPITTPWPWSAVIDPAPYCGDAGGCWELHAWYDPALARQPKSCTISSYIWTC